MSGSGTLVTGGKIYNGRKSGPTSEVTKILNGPSCSGTIAGPDVVKRVVNVGDVIIIPAGTPHGWTEIGDHVGCLERAPGSTAHDSRALYKSRIEETVASSTTSNRRRTYVSVMRGPGRSR